HELRQGRWNLLVTDIGFPPDTGSVLGMRLVHLAKEREVPCIVVSGTESVTKKHVVDMLLRPDYQARYFFTKQELQSSPDMQWQFEDLVRKEATKKATNVPNSSGPQPLLRAAPSGSVGGGLDPPSRRARKVTVGIRVGCVYLSSENLPTLLIPSGLLTKVFL